MAIDPIEKQKQKQFKAFMRANPQYDTRSVSGRFYDSIRKPLIITAGVVGLGWLGYTAYTRSDFSLVSWASNKKSDLELMIQNMQDKLLHPEKFTSENDVSTKKYVTTAPEVVSDDEDTSSSSQVESVVTPKLTSTERDDAYLNNDLNAISKNTTVSNDTVDIDDGDSRGIEERVYTAVTPKPSKKSISSVKQIVSSPKKNVSSSPLYFRNSFQFHELLHEYIRTGTEQKLGIPECQNFTVKHGQGALDSMTVVPFENIKSYHNQNNSSDSIDRLSDIVLEFQQGGKLLPLLQSSDTRKKQVVFLYNMSSSEPCNVPDGSVFNRYRNLNVNGRGFRLASSPNSYTVGYDPNLFALVAFEFIPDSSYTVNGNELGGKITNLTVRRAEIAALKEHKALAFGAGLIAGTAFPAGTAYVNAAALLSTVAGIGNNKGTPKHEITGVDTEVIRALAEQKSVSTNSINYLSGISSRHAGVVFNYDWTTDTFSSSDFPAMANTVIPLRAGNSEKITIKSGDYVGDVSVILVRQGASPVVLHPGWLRKLTDSNLETDLSDANVNGKRVVYTYRDYPHVPGKLVEQSNLFDNKWNINYRPSYDQNIIEMYLVINSYSPSSTYSSKDSKSFITGIDVIGNEKAGMGNNGCMNDSKAVISDSKSGMTPSQTYFIHIGNREIERDPHFLAWFAAGYNLHVPDKPPHKTSNPPGRIGDEVRGPPSRGGIGGGIGSRGGGAVGGPASGSGSSSYSPGSYTGGR